MNKKKNFTRNRSVYFLLITLFFLSCEKNDTSENKFTSSKDTLRIKTKKVQGMGLFKGGAGYLNFKDTSETFANSVIFPKSIDSIQRLELMVDFKPRIDTTYVEIIRGNKNGKPIFIVDENYNKDFRDDSIREYKEINWRSLSSLVKIKYMISDGMKMVQDSSWLRMGNLGGSFLLGKSEHHFSKFYLNEEEFSIATTEPRNSSSFSYLFDPKIALFSKLGIKKDSLRAKDLISLGEFLDLNGAHYRFDNITNSGNVITLIKENAFSSKVGTQVGMLAPKFTVVSTKSDTIKSSDFDDKVIIIANSCGCGGDVESPKAVSEIKNTFGDKVHVLQIDSNIEEIQNIYQVDSEEKFNKDFYETYRKQYCSRVCYVIGTNQRIVDKFEIANWKEVLPEIISR